VGVKGNGNSSKRIFSGGLKIGEIKKVGTLHQEKEVRKGALGPWSDGTGRSKKSNAASRGLVVGVK